jgi:hypothetical protein
MPPTSSRSARPGWAPTSADTTVVGGSHEIPFARRPGSLALLPTRTAFGTRKGLWTAAGNGAGWTVSQPIKQMAEFSSVALMSRSEDEPPRLLVGARSWFWGPSVLTSDDDGATWSEPDSGGIALPEGADVAVERIWNLTPDPREADVVWVGCEPHSLWRSVDGGRQFELTTALLDNPQRVGKPLRDDLDGIWSARRGTYRVHYRVREYPREVVVLRVDHRRDAYRLLT